MTCRAQDVRAGLCARFPFRPVLEASRRIRRSIGHGPALTRWALSAFLLLCSSVAWAETSVRVEAVVDGMPLSFEANTGKFDRRVKFLSRGRRQNLFLTNEGMVLTLDKVGSEVISIVRLELQNASPETKFEGIDRLPAITNYFSAGMQITNVPNFSRVRQSNAYPGIDILYYGNGGRIEYDFVVSPGADAKRIKFKLSGHSSAIVTESGDLVLATYSGDLVLKKPVAHQEQDGKHNDVPVRYVVAGNELRFDVSTYDPNRTIVIDPLLSYSTYLGGGSDDKAWAIALDRNGNAYIVGETFSTGFPLAGALQTKKAGSSDMFVTKMNPNGSGLVYSTYLGGKNGNTAGKGVAVDTAGNAYISGTTSSTAYPVTTGAYRTTGPGGFVTKLNAQGNALVYSTFTGALSGLAIALDGAGNTFVTGQAGVGFPTTSGAFQPVTAGGNDAIVLKLNATGSAAIYSTFLGGSGADSGNGIAVDSGGNAYVTGYTESSNFPVANGFDPIFSGVRDAFLTKLNPTGSGLVYSTYLGGSASDAGNAVALDPQGNAHVAGTTYSSDFPVVRAFQSTKAQSSTSVNQAFITKFDPTGTTLIYSSYLGGDPTFGCSGLCFLSGNDDSALAIAVDAAGNAYMAGQARTPNFFQGEPIQTDLVGYGPAIPFIAKVADRPTYQAIATLLYSVTLGRKIDTTTFADGGATGVAVDANGNAYVAGHIASPVLPTTPGAFQPTGNIPNDAVVFKISPGRFTTILSPSNSTATSTTPITLTAIVTSAVPGGTVTFTDNGNLLGTVPVSAGSAALTATFPAGVHELTATYSGDNKVSMPFFLPVTQATN